MLAALAIAPNLLVATTSVTMPPVGIWGLAATLFFLLVTVAVFAPLSFRRSLRVPLLMLTAWAVATVVWSIPQISLALREWCGVVSMVTLALATVRLGWIVLVEWVLSNGIAFGISRISRDLVQAVLYIIAAIAAARAAGADARALATTGGLVTAGLTFSLQQTLGDLVAGLLLQAEAPFKVGDWIAYDAEPMHHGRVAEINWRATKIVTIEMVELTVPNSVLSKATITNYHQPSLPSARCVKFTAAYAAPPREVQQCVAEAIAEADGVLMNPAPHVTLEDLSDLGVHYAARYAVSDHAARYRIDSAVRTRIWYAIRRAGIDLATPRSEIALVDLVAERASARTSGEARRRELFDTVDFLAPLSVDERTLLARNASTVIFARGERVFSAGDLSAELYIVSRGALAVFAGEGTSEIARFGPGEFFGEMALLTGEPRSATVRAVTDSVLCVVDKATFEPVLAGHRELFEQISKIVAARQDEAAARRGEARAGAGDLKQRELGVLDRMRRFFGRDHGAAGA